MTYRVISWLLYAMVGVVFAVAAVVKIGDPERFLSSLLTYELFSSHVASALALFAPILEMLVALFLFFGVLRQGAKLLAAAMLLLFIVLIVQGMARGLDLDCGCFGTNVLKTQTDYFLKLGQNALLFLSLLVAHFLENKSKQSNP